MKTQIIIKKKNFQNNLLKKQNSNHGRIFTLLLQYADKQNNEMNIFKYVHMCLSRAHGANCITVIK